MSAVNANATTFTTRYVITFVHNVTVPQMNFANPVSIAKTYIKALNTHQMTRRRTLRRVPVNQYLK